MQPPPPQVGLIETQLSTLPVSVVEVALMALPLLKMKITYGVLHAFRLRKTNKKPLFGIAQSFLLLLSFMLEGGGNRLSVTPPLLQLEGKRLISKLHFGVFVRDLSSELSNDHRKEEEEGEEEASAHILLSAGVTFSAPQRQKNSRFLPFCVKK